MTPTHFAATLRARGRLPEVTIHGPICDRLLLPLAGLSSRATGWSGGHRATTVGGALGRIRNTLSVWYRIDRDGFIAEPLTEAEHAARFPDEPETPMVGGHPAAMFPERGVNA